MTQKLKYYLTAIISVFAFSLPLMIPATSYATNYCISGISGKVANSVNDVTGSTSNGVCSGKGGITSSVQSIAKTAVNLLSIVVGVVAIIFIIYGGFKYITSGGESGSVESAKKTLIMAIIGLIIVALAQVIVHFVLTESANISNNVNGFIRF